MKSDKIIITGIAGTSAMTLFSYIVSEYKDKNFKEPEVLGDLTANLDLIGKKASEVTGWGLHYAMGETFATIYNYFWQKKKLRPSAANGLLLGGISSLAGILIWDLTFKLHPNPPVVHLKKYYGHLILAHLIFGAVSAIVYKKSTDRS